MQASRLWGNAKPLADVDEISAKVVPNAEIANRNMKMFCDAVQSVAAAHPVEGWMRVVGSAAGKVRMEGGVLRAASGGIVQVEVLANVDEVSADMIPAAQIGNGDVEPIGDSAKVVAAAHIVDLCVRCAGVRDPAVRVGSSAAIVAASGSGNTKQVAGIDEVSAQVVPDAELTHADTEAIGDGDERIAAPHAVKNQPDEVLLWQSKPQRRRLRQRRPQRRRPQ